MIATVRGASSASTAALTVSCWRSVIAHFRCGSC
jgi:hypothetical protein